MKAFCLESGKIASVIRAIVRATGTFRRPGTGRGDVTMALVMADARGFGQRTRIKGGGSDGSDGRRPALPHLGRPQMVGGRQPLPGFARQADLWHGYRCC